MVGRMKWLKEAMIAALLVFPVFYGVDRYQSYQRSLEQQRKQDAPVTDWMIVRDVVFPDYIEGNDPLILYDRQIVREFTGKWFVVLHPKSLPDSVACHGDGEFRYQPNIVIPDKRMLMSIFVGKDCDLIPGEYFGEVRWEVKPDGYPMKPLVISIPAFKVLPKR